MRTYRHKYVRTDIRADVSMYENSCRGGLRPLQTPPKRLRRSGFAGGGDAAWGVGVGTCVLGAFLALSDGGGKKGADTVLDAYP